MYCGAEKLPHLTHHHLQGFHIPCFVHRTKGSVTSLGVVGWEGRGSSHILGGKKPEVSRFLKLRIGKFVGNSSMNRHQFVESMGVLRFSTRAKWICIFFRVSMQWEPTARRSQWETKSSPSISEKSGAMSLLGLNSIDHQSAVEVIKSEAPKRKPSNLPIYGFQNSQTLDLCLAPWRLGHIWNVQVYAIFKLRRHMEDPP
jgi:hypothetical protein